MQTDGRNINTINEDATACRVNLEYKPVRYSLEVVEHRRTKRKILIARVDLPLPVRPNNPTRSLALSWKDTPCNTGGSSGAYFSTRSSTEISASLLELEDEGQ